MKWLTLIVLITACSGGSRNTQLPGDIEKNPANQMDNPELERYFNTFRTFTPRDELAGEFEFAFISDRDGQIDIYLAPSDTTYITRITRTRQAEYNPQFSPDGNWLYFTDYSRAPAVWRVNLTNGVIEKLKPGVMAQLVCVAPNDSAIVIRATHEHSRGEYYLFQSGRRKLVRLTRNAATELGGVFHPNGDRLIVSIADTGETLRSAHLYDLNLRSNRMTRLTRSPGIHAAPDIHSSGNRIIWHTLEDSIGFISRMDADGDDVEALTERSSDFRWPRFTPDGDHILMTKTTHGNTDIWRMAADGESPERVIASRHRDETVAIRIRRQK